MMSSRRIKHHYQACFCWLSRRNRARIHPLNSQPAALAIISRNQQGSHLHRLVHSPERKKTSLHPSCPHIVSVTDVPKSP
jgi:hypothetical protein